LYAQVEPRLAGGNAEREPSEKESLDYFREATQIPFLSAGGFSRQAAIDAVQANKADGIVFGEGIPEHHIAPATRQCRWHCGDAAVWHRT
jgi:phosphoribosylformimino-5-aminoimidazole carboxamide ribonucleotide (ProFAR) isomerase